MASLEELRNARIKKAEALRADKKDPYPAQIFATHTIAQALSDFDSLVSKKEKVTLAGRILGKREHGSLLFLDVASSGASIQFYFQKNDISEEDFKNAKEYLDIGDFLEAQGELLVTQSGHKSLGVKTWRMLTKSLRPLPETHYGLKDTEERLRRRYLDLLVNRQVRELFEKKTVFWSSMRNFLNAHGFLEVETPVLEMIPGGAEAEPFVTHYNALDKDFYLRISLELPLKRLIVGGFEKVFEIGRIFRNEGIDAEHLQDYTQMEFYFAYADYNELMDFLQKMYQEVIEKTCGSLMTTHEGVEINWKAPWPKIEYFDIFKKETGIDLHKADGDDLRAYAKKLGIDVAASFGKGRLIDLIFKKTCRSKIVQPSFLINPPVEIEPLAKRMAEDPKRVQRLQIMAGGTELGKGFSELNDPMDQRARFEEQMKLREAGDKEAQQLDEDYIEALEYGMPPTAGFGVSERLFAFLMDKPIRETIIFPPLKPRHD